MLDKSISTQPQNELDAIGKALQAQYERWQPRAKYKLQLDPTTDDMKKLCISCRRNAKGERVLLHYNGHGVPRPTANGEIWVFNKSYTQYIPLSIFDLRAWTGTPAIYVFDCSNAGLIIKSFLKLQQQAEETPSSQAVMRDLESRQAGGSMAFAELSENRSDLAGPSGFGTSESSSSAKCILMRRGGANEILPQSVDLPADVFSACLTTPVKMALHWFCTNSVLREQGITVDIIDNIPGMQNNRKTPLVSSTGFLRRSLTRSHGMYYRVNCSSDYSDKIYWWLPYLGTFTRGTNHARQQLYASLRGRDYPRRITILCGLRGTWRWNNACFKYLLFFPEIRVRNSFPRPSSPTNSRRLKSG